MTNLDKKLQKLWALVSTLRKNEIMLRELHDKQDSKPALKSSKTLPSLKKHESEKVFISYLLNFCFLVFKRPSCLDNRCENRNGIA